MTAPTAPLAIHLESERYIMRTLEPADANEAWGQWMTDPDTVRNLNIQPRHVSIETLQTYIKSFNRTTSHLVGTIEKSTSRLIGIRSIYVNWEKGEFLSNTLVGESEARHKGVLKETHRVIFAYFFNTLDLVAAQASAVSTNTVILDLFKSRGWIHQHSARKPAADGQGFVEIHHYRMPRDVWRKRYQPGEWS